MRLRFLPSDSPLDAVGACALWAGGPAVAVVIGGYPRLAEFRRRDSVAAERRAQRLALARDLHDFVAHDVSGIVALAQAARFVAGADPARALDALARVEAAGLRALDTMDRTVAMLGDLAGPPGAEPGLGDLPALLPASTARPGSSPTWPRPTACRRRSARPPIGWCGRR